MSMRKGNAADGFEAKLSMRKGNAADGFEVLFEAKLSMRKGNAADGFEAKPTLQCTSTSISSKNAETRERYIGVLTFARPGAFADSSCVCFNDSPGLKNYYYYMLKKLFSLGLLLLCFTCTLRL